VLLRALYRVRGASTMLLITSSVITQCRRHRCAIDQGLGRQDREHLDGIKRLSFWVHLPETRDVSSAVLAVAFWDVELVMPEPWGRWAQSGTHSGAHRREYGQCE